MKVIMENKNAKSVKELPSGECFLWDHKLFIVTDEDSGDGRRCVRLATGVIYYFEEETVTPVDAEVIIHD